MNRGGSSARPTGTDGSDYAFRMTVDNRYKVAASARKNLHRFLAIQTFYIIVRLIWPGMMAMQGLPFPWDILILCATGALAGLVGTLAAKGNSEKVLGLYIVLTAVTLALCTRLYSNGDYIDKLFEYWAELEHGDRDWTFLAGHAVVGFTDVCGSVAQVRCILCATRLMRSMAPKTERAVGGSRKTQ